MAEVIKLADVKKPPQTKQVSFEHGGQRYICMYDQNAPTNERWVWYVDYIKTYRYMGSAPTMERASSDARRKIHALNKRLIADEEARS